MGWPSPCLPLLVRLSCPESRDWRGLWRTLWGEPTPLRCPRLRPPSIPLQPGARVQWSSCVKSGPGCTLCTAESVMLSFFARPAFVTPRSRIAFRATFAAAMGSGTGCWPSLIASGRSAQVVVGSKRGDQSVTSSQDRRWLLRVRPYRRWPFSSSSAAGVDVSHTRNPFYCGPSTSG